MIINIISVSRDNRWEISATLGVGLCSAEFFPPFGRISLREVGNPAVQLLWFCKDSVVVLTEVRSQKSSNLKMLEEFDKKK